MAKNSTLFTQDDNSSLNHVTLTYFDEPVLEPAGKSPRPSTIERIRQFARAAYCHPSLPEVTIVLN